MGRHKKQELVITGDAERGYELRGHMNGRRFRRRSRVLEDLESIKNREEHALAKARASTLTTALRQTWLSEAQLRDAEAAATRAGNHRLLDCVVAAERVLPRVERIACTTARDEWLAELKQRGRFPRTLAKNKDRVDRFLAHAGEPRFLTDLNPDMAHAWVFRGTKGYTALTDATVLLGWLRWCVRRRYLALLPAEIDTRDLAERSRSIATARILTPAEAGRLLEAAATIAGGKLVPYVVLTTWCMLRHAEALRTTPAQIKLNLAVPVVETAPRKRRTASYRQVPIPANVLPFLRAAVERGAFDWQPPAPKPRRSRPPKGKRPVRPAGTYWTRSAWLAVRTAAGLKQWQENLLRHTGISYRHQATGDMRQVCREAGNSDETSFRHYLTLPHEGDATKFYGAELVAKAAQSYMPRQSV